MSSRASTPAPIPVLALVAPSGTGKTSLLERLLPALGQRGLRVAVIKHSHHQIVPDQPGKDSYRLQQAGAAQVLLVAPNLQAHFIRPDADTTQDTPRATLPLDSLLARVAADRPNLILLEGFAHARVPKLELHRPSLGLAPLYPQDSDIIAIASNAPLEQPSDLPLLNLDSTAEITDFIRQFMAAPAAPVETPNK